MYSCLELTPRSRVLFEKLSVSQLVKKFPAFYGTRRFITAFTSVRHLSLSWARSIQYISPHPTYDYLKKIITFEYYRHSPLHGWVIAIDHYGLLPLNVDYCRFLPSYATPRIVLTKSITIPPVTILKVLPKFQVYAFPTTHTRAHFVFYIQNARSPSYPHDSKNCRSFADVKQMSFPQECSWLLQCLLQG